MKYGNIVKGIFIDRPNRFIAYVKIHGEVETVHVKNTGRCRELLIPGVEVILEMSDNPKRKTKYDLVTVHKDGIGWINIDSQAPNKIAAEWLSGLGFQYIKPEYTFGKSRIDFYLEKGNMKCLMEVKGCTLEIDGVGYFPDAPTTRGVKHLIELQSALAKNYCSYITFVIQMNGIDEVRPYGDMHKEFEEAFVAAKEAGVKVIFLCCHVTEKEIIVTHAIGANDLYD